MPLPKLNKPKTISVSAYPPKPKPHTHTKLIRTVMYGVRLSQSHYYLTSYRIWHDPKDERYRSMMLFPTIELAEKEIAWFKAKNWQEWMEPFEVQLEWESKDV